MTAIDPRIKPYLDAATKADYEVTLPSLSSNHHRGPITYAYVTHPEKPGCVYIQRDITPLATGVSLAAPIKPSREYGSSVHIDFYEQTPDAFVRLLETQLDKTEIQVRFIKHIAFHAIERADRKHRHAETTGETS